MFDGNVDRVRPDKRQHRSCIMVTVDGLPGHARRAGVGAGRRHGDVVKGQDGLHALVAHPSHLHTDSIPLVIVDHSAVVIPARIKVNIVNSLFTSFSFDNANVFHLHIHQYLTFLPDQTCAV